MARQPLPPETVAERMKELSGWSLGEGRISRTFRFPSFTVAMAFMAGAGTVAEKLDHHPEWRNVYGTVEVTLTTHDADGLTEKDFRLAAAMDHLSSGLLG